MMSQPSVEEHRVMQSGSGWKVSEQSRTVENSAV